MWAVRPEVRASASTSRTFSPELARACAYSLTTWVVPSPPAQPAKTRVLKGRPLAAARSFSRSPMYSVGGEAGRAGRGALAACGGTEGREGGGVGRSRGGRRATFRDLRFRVSK